MNKILIVSAKNKKSLKIKNLLLNKIKNHKFNFSKLTIVIGGDGFMLETLKKYKDSNKLFYGVNSGNYGFLMNKFSSNNFVKNLLKAKMISISPQ
jgi:NAD+ kinase